MISKKARDKVARTKRKQKNKEEEAEFMRDNMVCPHCAGRVIDESHWACCYRRLKCDNCGLQHSIMLHDSTLSP